MTIEPNSAGEAIINAVIMAGAIASVEVIGDNRLFVWKANASEQIEAALASLGWTITKSHP